MKAIIVSMLFTLTILNMPSLYAASYGFGLGPRNQQNVPSIGILDDVIEDTNTYYVGDTNEKDIYLTFDTGYELGYTSDILDTLKDNDVNATFFVTGDFVNRNSSLVRRMAEEGHNVGNHTMTHPDITVLSESELKSEIISLENKYKDITGMDMSPYFRPPRGMLSTTSLKRVNDLGYINVFWSLAFVDWQIDRQQGYEYSYNNIMNKIHPGAIILLHTVSCDNKDALGLVIKDLRAQGYRFKNLNDLMLKEIEVDLSLTSISF